MKSYKCLLFIAFIFFSMSSYANECLVKTELRPLMTGMAGLEDEKINEGDGRYTAVLNNGDVILAQFARCDLAMQANYMSVKSLDNTELLKLLEEFLTQILASDAVAQKVLPQLKSISSAALQKAVTLQGLNDQHQIIVKPAASPNFHTIIQYNWIAPEH